MTLHQVPIVIFNCHPIRAQWDITITDKRCTISQGTIYISGSIPNVVTDVLILLMPVPYVWRLRAPLAQKLILGAMFALACFVSIVSIVRLIILIGIPLASSDVTYNFKELIMWSVVEPNIGLVCACLPSMKLALQPLRLSRLIQKSANRQDNNRPDPNIYPPTIGRRSDRSMGHKKVGFPIGLFSTLVGLTRLDDEEDGLQMLDKTHAVHGKSMSENEIATRVDTNNESRGESRKSKDDVVMTA